MGSCRVCVICWRPSSVHGSPWTGYGRVLGGHKLIGEFGVEVWSERRDVGSCRVRCTSCKPISAFCPPRNCWPAPKHPSTRDGGGSAVVVIIHRRASSAGVRSRADTDKARAPNEAPTRHPGERGLGKRSSNRAHHLHSPHQHVTPWPLANPLHGLTCPGKGVQSAGPVIGCWTCLR